MEVGTTVKLKSGGPIMTVVVKYTGVGEPQVLCRWFEGNVIRNEDFPIASLEVTVPQGQPKE